MGWECLRKVYGFFTTGPESSGSLGVWPPGRVAGKGIMTTLNAETLARVRATFAAVNVHYPAKSPGALLTFTNPKVNKEATERGYMPAILHLAPSTMVGADLCQWATPECRAACLNTAGRGGIGLDASGWNVIQAARIRRAAAMLLTPDDFADRLTREITAHARRARRHGLAPALRLNGTSDLPWHRTMPDVIAHAHAEGCTLYDYTKRVTPDAADYGIDLTYSYPGGNGAAARRYLAAGQRVAVVFSTRKGHALPREWHAPWGEAVPVIDGDAHDLRFMDPGGVIVGLRAKGNARRITPTPTGFIQQG